jgi:hypothetical protein
MPYPSALQPFQGWPTSRAGSLPPSSTLLDTPRRTPMGRAAPPNSTKQRSQNRGFHDKTNALNLEIAPWWVGGWPSLSWQPG